jgi:hypothetical protein
MSQWARRFVGRSDRSDHHVKKADVGFVWIAGWTQQKISGWHFSFVTENHIAYWHSNEGTAHNNIIEFRATLAI